MAVQRELVISKKGKDSLICLGYIEYAVSVNEDFYHSQQVHGKPQTQ